jgi:anti-sigma factor RsiW
MTNRIDCREAEELLTAHLEGTLPAPLSADVETHLAGCAGCRDLRAALADVVEALRSYPILEPTKDLAERAAAAALARQPRLPSRMTAGWLDYVGLPAGLQVLAAALAMAVTGTVVLAATEGARIRERTVSAGAYLSERKDRLVEDVRLLRVVVTTAFEGRLDRMNDRVDDYRRLIEKRRATQQEQKRTGPPQSDTTSTQSARRADFPRNFFLSNLPRGPVVTACERVGPQRPDA